LRRLQAITDTALSHLELEDLLHELLNRIYDVLGVDDAAILLVEERAEGEGSQTLVLRAARGLEEPAVGVRVPVEQGFSGRIAATRAPLIVDDLSTIPVVYLVLREHVRSAVGVPLLLCERLLGVIHIGTAQPHRFTEADVEFLQHAAERIALAIERAELYETERAARREAEAALAAVSASEERLRLFVENVPAAVAMLDCELRYLAASRRWRQYYLFGEDYLGRSHYDLFPEIPERWKDIHRRCLAGAVESSDEDRFERADGSVQWLKWEIRPWYSQPGEVGGLVIFMEDLTERKRLEQEREAALRRSEEWFRSMANTAPVMLWVTDTEALTTFVNEPWLQFTGRALEQELGNGWTADIHPDDVQRCMETYLSAFHARQRFTLECRVRRADGNYRLTLTSGVPRFTWDGVFEGYIGSVVDVTEREQLVQEREQAEARELAAREVAQQLDQFFAMASHDIRSPVTALIGNVQMAHLRAERLASAVSAHDGRDAEQATALLASLDQADESGERLQRLVPLLFDVARARTGTLTLTLAPCDLVALAQEQVAAQQTAAPGRTLQLDAPDHVVWVDADADRLRQVLTNFLSNALKYSADDQPVRARLAMQEQRAVVSVQDHGPGLPPEELSRVWELYHRAPGVEEQGSTGAASGSLGMGLHICKRLIELHPGGVVGVDSTLGAGSTFWFSLPVVLTEG
jgi:PAS domain S-box-containing protein